VFKEDYMNREELDGGGFGISVYSISAIISFIPCFKTWESAKNALNALVGKYTEERVKMALSGTWR
jgi:hypothetical protein